MSLSFTSNLFILPILLIALGTVYLLSGFAGIDVKTHRYSAIDGVRGYLAMFVFLHHSVIWWYWIHDHNKWGAVPNYLYKHFGTASVGFFFMITSFLFFTKLIEASGKGRFDWLKLYVSRIMRIMPLYLFAMAALFLSVGMLSHFELRESLSDLFRHIGQWLIFMEPDINKVKDTKLIISGVQWSLAYEWLFYCSLAIIGMVCFRIRASASTLILTLLFGGAFFFVIYSFYSERWIRATPFGTGILAAFLVRNKRVRQIATEKWLLPVLLALFVLSAFYYSRVFAPVPFTMFSLVFIAIAGGNTFMGILTTRASRLLGQISYSLYLLHALVLSTVFNFILVDAKTYSVLDYWLVIAACTIVVVAVCSLTWLFIEKPFIDRAPSITGRLRQYLTKPAPDAFAGTYKKPTPAPRR